MVDRVAVLSSDGTPLGWTYDGDQYAAVRREVLDAPDPAHGMLLEDLVARAQDRLGSSPLFPSGRLTNATHYVVADLRGRGRSSGWSRPAPRSYGA